MANVVLILGNGFDVDLGLKSKYTDFIKENEWQKLCSFVVEKFSEKFKNYSLLEHMHKAGNAPSLWFDVENEIHKFVINYPWQENEIPAHLVDLHKSEFGLLREALYRYLQRITNDFSLDENKWSYRLLQTLTESNDKIDIFTFNYTNSCKICKLPQLDFTYIHGSLDGNDIVLGCERIGRGYIPLSFTFLLKSNLINKPNNIIKKLREANEVIFFGHSLNEFDFPYFQEFFRYICEPIEHELHLTFITKDKNSEIAIRDNLWAQGIPVQNLYKSNIETTFIHSATNDHARAKEQDKFDALLKRIGRDYLIM